jgi:hypothetical protein
MGRKTALSICAGSSRRRSSRQELDGQCDSRRSSSGPDGLSGRRDSKFRLGRKYRRHVAPDRRIRIDRDRHDDCHPGRRHRSQRRLRLCARQYHLVGVAERCEMADRGSRPCDPLRRGAVRADQRPADRLSPAARLSDHAGHADADQGDRRISAAAIFRADRFERRRIGCLGLRRFGIDPRRALQFRDSDRHGDRRPVRPDATTHRLAHHGGRWIASFFL